MKDTEVHKIGIIICDRYHRCGGGKCFRALKNREGAFDIYENRNIEVVGYSTCGGCPGGNIEYVPEEMKKNGAETIHLATGMVVGYPPCPRVKYFKKYIEEKFDINVVVGTHPIPEKYYEVHKKLKTWQSEEWTELIAPTLSPKQTRIEYN
ncbi:MAG: CGGC domain-containing protein [Bacteroidales bacterium]